MVIPLYSKAVGIYNVNLKLQCPLVLHLVEKMLLFTLCFVLLKPAVSRSIPETFGLWIFPWKSLLLGH